MPDTTPLLASLLMGQRQDYSNPFQQQRKYGQDLIIKGSSTAPLGSGSPLEGLARALQGGLGGVMAGLANRQEEDQNQHNVGIYSQAAAERDPQKAAELLKGLKGGGYQQEALLGQIIQNNINEGLKQQQAQGVYTRSGAGSGTTPGGGTGNGLVIDINKPTQVSGTMPPELEPHFQAAAQKYNLPVDLLKKAAGTESAFNPNAVSPAGAGGIMQLMPGTAGDLGVRNRFDSAQSIDGGANYLRQQLDKYGNIPHALAAYNWGPGNVDNWLKAGADPSKLPAETQAYIAKVAGGGQAAPQRPQMAQAQGPQPSPPQIGQVPPSPEAAQFRAQEQQFARQGDYVQANTYRQKALEAEAKWASTLQQKQAEIGMQGAEHDRQQATATPNNEQALSSTFANRMHNSNQIIGQVGAALGDFKSRSIDSKVFGVGVPGSNYMVSPEYQQAKQARNDFINAQLRRESGAAISDSEYERADQQYFPQPGDGPDVLAQKAKNRQLAVEGMIGSAGPAFKMSPTVGAAPAAKAGGNELLDQAREAIRQGKDKAKVIEVLKANGGDPGQL